MHHGLMTFIPCFTNFFDQNSLQVGILLSLQFQPPEVPKSQFAVPVLFAPWISTEHEVDSVLLVVDQLVCVPGVITSIVTKLYGVKFYLGRGSIICLFVQ